MFCSSRSLLVSRGCRERSEQPRGSRRKLCRTSTRHFVQTHIGDKSWRASLTIALNENQVLKVSRYIYRDTATGFLPVHYNRAYHARRCRLSSQEILNLDLNRLR